MEELEGRDQPAALNLSFSLPGLLDLGGRDLLGLGSSDHFRPSTPAANHSNGIERFGLGSESHSASRFDEVIVLAPFSTLIIVIAPTGTGDSSPPAGGSTSPSTGTTSPSSNGSGTAPTPGGTPTGSASSAPAASPTSAAASSAGSALAPLPAVSVVNVVNAINSAISASIASLLSSTVLLPPGRGLLGGTSGANDSTSPVPVGMPTDPNAGLISPVPAPHLAPNTWGGWGSNSLVRPEDVGLAPAKPKADAAPVEVAPPPREVAPAEPAAVPAEQPTTAANPLLALTTVSAATTDAAAVSADASESVPAAATAETPAGSKWSWFAGAAAAIAGVYWAVRRTLVVRKLTARVRPTPVPRFFEPYYSTDLSVEPA
jgi:hypothetical protein